MSAAKIAITIEEGLVEQVDRLVREHVYPNRSRAIQDAVADKLRRMDRGRLARECAKLDPKFEQALAEEGIGSEIAQWPEYCGATSSGPTSNRHAATSKRGSVQF
jgi:Arc/MetJ-type ribon-helix-helix transcriptional regulator